MPRISSTGCDGIHATHGGECIVMTSPSISSLMPLPRNAIAIIAIRILVTRKNGLSGSFTPITRIIRYTNTRHTQPTAKPSHTILVFPLDSSG